MGDAIKFKKRRTGLARMDIYGHVTYKGDFANAGNV